LNKASGMIGTTAELLTGDVLTMYDALHGMMLPSGNDAAQALADFFHKYMTFNNK
jgi:D-alanyl-D-alanine carboxypeptidase